MSQNNHTSRTASTESFREMTLEYVQFQQQEQDLLSGLTALRNTYRSISSISVSYRKDMIANSQATSDFASSAKESKSLLTELGGTLKSKAFGWVIDQAINLIAAGFDNLIHSAERCKERVDELMSSYASAMNTANDHAKTVESFASRYEKLSAGVNNLGQNVSLTADEYAEYKDIANQIADMFPQLIQGYTDEGDAILSLKGNVEQLRDAYQEAQQEAYNMLLSGTDANGNDIIKNWTNLQNTDFWKKSLLPWKKGVGFTISMQDALDQLTAFSEMSADRFRSVDLQNGSENLTESERIISNSDYIKNTLGVSWLSTDEELKAAKQRARALAQIYQAEIDSALNNVELLANAYLVTDETYAAMDEQSKNVASIMVNNLNASVANGFENQADIGAYVQKIIDFVKDNPQFGDVLEDLLAVPSDDHTLSAFARQYERAFETAKSYCEQNGIEIPIIFTENDYIKAYRALQDSVRQIVTAQNRSAITQAAQDSLLLGTGSGAMNLLYTETDIYKELSDYTKDFTAAQAEIWFDATMGARNAEEAIQRYENRMRELAASPLSITEAVDHINTQLKPALDSLQSAYADIFRLDDNTGEMRFSRENVDIDTYQSIQSALDILNSFDGITIPYSAYEQLVSVLNDTASTAEDVQNQFDRLATNMIYATDCTNLSAETYDLLVQSLNGLGVTNAADVLSHLNDLQQELIEHGHNVVTITAKEAAQLIKQGQVSVETAEYLKQYLLQKELSQNPLNTLSDILALENLCNALGVTGELYECVNDLKRAFAAKESGAVSSGLDESIDSLQKKIEALSSGELNFGFRFGDITPSETSASSAARSAAETYDWIERAIENVEKEIKNLDEIANAGYSTFSQKNEALAQEIGKISDEIALQQQAYDEYLRKAEAVGLSDHYKNLVQNGAAGLEEISDEALQNQISEYQKWYEKAQDASDAVRELKANWKDRYISSYELQTTDLKERLDSSSITEKQYLEELKTAYTKFYENLEDYAGQYHEAVLDYLKQEKDYLGSVAGSAASLIDAEIDKLREDAAAQESGIERQIELLNDRKKPLQDELDALEDKAKQENLILSLQKAQYDLARAENQRTKLIYTEDGGMVYTADSTAIRSAKKDVDDARLEIQKQSIQDQIDLLDDEIDRYNDLIDQINTAADNQISALEQIKNKWQELIDQQEYAKNLSLFTEEFGSGAVEMLLSGNDESLLAQWEQNYIDTLADIDLESQGYIGSMTEQLAALYGVDLSPLQTQFRDVTDSIDATTGALKQTAQAIGIGSTSEQKAPSADAGKDTALSSAGSGSLEAAIKSETAAAMDSFDRHTEKLTEEVIPAIHSAAEEMNLFNIAADTDIEKTVTITYCTAGDPPPSDGTRNGAAHAEGTAKVTGDWGVRRAGTALVGELGQEMVVSPDGTWRTVGDHGAEFVNLQENDIVFNHLQTQELLRGRTLSKPKPTSAAPSAPAAIRIDAQGASDGAVYASGQPATQNSSLSGAISPGDRAWELQQRVQPLLEKLNGNLDILSGGAMAEHSRQMEQMLTQLTASNIVNQQNVQPNIHVDSITITCPGVTSKEVMAEVGAALDEKFRGFHNYADQQSRIR